MATEDVNIRYTLEDKASAGITSLKNGLAGLLSPLGITTLSISGLAAVISKMVGDAEDSEAVMRETHEVIASMGNVAGITADQIADLSTAISLQTNYTDEQVQSAANMLLTFKEINKDVFPETLKLTIDLAAKMKTDATTAAIQFGKAINDPINGLSSLARVGVKFSEEQRRQIQLMVESGNMMSAQKIIMAELDSQFHNASIALSSPFIRAKNAVGELSEALGRVLLPTATSLTDQFTKGLTILTQYINSFTSAEGKVGRLGQKLESLREQQQMYNSIIAKNIPILTDLMKKELEKTNQNMENVAKEIQAIQDAENKKQSEYKKTSKKKEDEEQKSSTSIMEIHSLEVSRLQKDNEYSYQKEIDLLNKRLSSHKLTADEAVKVETARNELIVKMNAEAGQTLIDQNKVRWEQAMQMGDIAALYELDNQKKLLESDKLNTEQKKEYAKDLAQKRMKLEEDYGRMAMEATKDFGDKRVSIEQQVMTGLGRFIKEGIMQQIRAWAAFEAGKATAAAIAAIIPTFGGSMLVLGGQLASIYAVIASTQTALNSIFLADGGIVMPRPGGVQATIGEAGKAEAVIPLNTKKAKDMLGGSGDSQPQRVIILDSDGVTMLAKGMYRKQQYLQRTGQISGGLI